MNAFISIKGQDVFSLPIAVGTRAKAEELAAEKYGDGAEVVRLTEFCHGRCGKDLDVSDKPTEPYYCPDCALWREMTLKGRGKTLLAALTRATAAMVEVGA